MWTHEEFIDEENHADVWSNVQQRGPKASIKASNAFHLKNSLETWIIGQFASLLSRTQILARICDQSGRQFGQDTTAQTFKVTLQRRQIIMLLQCRMKADFCHYTGFFPGAIRFFSSSYNTNWMVPWETFTKLGIKPWNKRQNYFAQQVDILGKVACFFRKHSHPIASSGVQMQLFGSITL